MLVVGLSEGMKPFFLHMKPLYFLFIILHFSRF
jgi:hypothetical protein